MKKSLLLCTLLLSAPFMGISQEQQPAAKTEIGKTAISSQMQYSNKFAIRETNFNKRIDTSGKGEILEVELEFVNLTDDPMDLYILIITSFEKTEKTISSFEIPISEKERIRSFIPSHGDVSNFEYPATDDQGNVLKDESGRNKVKLLKIPKDPKVGVDPESGKPYHLKDRLMVRTWHLSPYRTNYFYFNEVTVLVFNEEGKPVYRQLYSLNGIRR